MESKWIVRRGDKHTTPLSLEQLKGFANTGKLHREDQVRHEHGSGWEEAWTIEGLFDTLRAPLSPGELEQVLAIFIAPTHTEDRRLKRRFARLAVLWHGQAKEPTVGVHGHGSKIEPGNKQIEDLLLCLSATEACTRDQLIRYFDKCRDILLAGNFDRGPHRKLRDLSADIRLTITLDVVHLATLMNDASVLGFIRRPITDEAIMLQYGGFHHFSWGSEKHYGVNNPIFQRLTTVDTIKWLNCCLETIVAYLDSSLTRNLCLDWYVEEIVSEFSLPCILHVFVHLRSSKTRASNRRFVVSVLRLTPEKFLCHSMVREYENREHYDGYEENYLNVCVGQSETDLTSINGLLKTLHPMYTVR